MIQSSNVNMCQKLRYILSARFQLKNWDAPARLDSAWKFFSSDRLSSGNLSSNSSLLPMFECYSPDRNWIHISSIHSKIESHLMTKIYLCQGKFNLTRSFRRYWLPNMYCLQTFFFTLKKFAGVIWNQSTFGDRICTW